MNIPRKTLESIPHPAIVMSRPRANAWLKQATDDQFFEYLDTLAIIYAKRQYKGDGKLQEDLLLKDYAQWRTARFKRK